MRSYVVVYRAETTPIEILRIISGRRDLAEQLTWGVSETVEPATAYAQA